MSALGPQPRSGDTGASTEEVELAQVLESYLAQLEAGGPADPEGLIAAHPGLARPLRACLKVMHLAQGLDESGQLPAGPLAVDGGAFGAVHPAGSSALMALWPGDDRPPGVLLPEPTEDDSPIVLTHSDALLTTGGGTAGRYQVLGEIARGGMGVVFKARDTDLGRDLALKVLLDRHRGDQDVVRRFVEEAQIGGQLQHPGIVPVHELGTLDDLRPFFAMTLVKGRTLAALLAERPGPATDLPRFLQIFEAICQTMAYAHARRVIHRDLKPANVMVGNFGEVQVMDWGLAKVLAEGGVADEAKAARIAETAILTVRSGSAGSGSESQAGSVLGTPAYMAPEQARGDVEQIDERADVFGLGAILCEILTGRPPYGGSTREEIRDKAARGDLTDAVGRLDASGVEVDLVALAKACMAAELGRRPRNAGAAVERVTSFLNGVQERLRLAELARVEAQARAEEEGKRRVLSDELAEEAVARARIERSRRRRTVALAASVLITASVGGGGWAYLARQRQGRATRVAIALSKVDALRIEAERAGDDLARWRTARDAAGAVEGLLLDAADESTQRRATELVRDVTQAAAAAENDQKLLAKLVNIRSAKSDDIEGLVTDAHYADAFREAGMDLAASPPADMGAKIRARPTAIRLALAAALDDWAAVRRDTRRNRDSARLPTEVARLADPDPWRNRLRELLQTSATQERLTSLRDLAKSARIDEMPAVSVLLLGGALLDMGDPAVGGAVLREGQRLHPDDVWLNFTLAVCLERQGRRDEAIRYYMAARSRQPETAHSLAHALDQKGETDQAIAVFQDLARRQPLERRHLSCLGAALQAQGRTQEANTVLDAAIDAARGAIALKHDSATTHFDLGLTLLFQGKLKEASAELREGIRLKPDSSGAHSNLGAVLAKQGELDEAIAEFREAIRLSPSFPDPHANLGDVLQEQAKLDDAVAEYREAIRLGPGTGKFHNNLAIALSKEGKLNEAIEEARTAVRLNPDYNFRNNLGALLQQQGKLGEAIAEFREVIRLMPEFHDGHYNLSLTLRKDRKRDEAIAEIRTALRLKPDSAKAHLLLGNLLRDQGKVAEAIATYREALRLEPDFAIAHNNLSAALADQGKGDEAITASREAVRLEPDHAASHFNLGNALKYQGKADEAITAYREAVRLKPDFAEAHNNLSIVLATQGKLDEALSASREAVRLKPDYAEAHGDLGVVLAAQGKLDEAITAYREVLRLDPDSAEAHWNLGNVFRQQGRFDEALAELKRGLELGSKNPNWHRVSGEEVREIERLVEHVRKLPAILDGKAKASDAAESLAFAEVCYLKKLHGASARLWSEAFRAQPKLADDMQIQNRYNAACAAALAGGGQGKDDPPLDDAAKARWRKQAMDWLKADLTAWSKILDNGAPQARQTITQTLQHWKADTDLAGIREPAALAKLPGDEQPTCRAIWSQVEALLAKSQGTKGR